MKKKMTCSSGWAIAFAVVFFLTGCKFDLPAPPRQQPGAPPVAPVRSTLAIPVTVNVEALKAQLEETLKAKPLFEGRSPELSVKLLAEEKSIFQEPRKIIDVPFKAAVCQVEKIPETVTTTIKTGTRVFKCLLRPWKWGDCAEDVFETVTKTIWKEVTKCVPAQVEVARTVYTAVERVTPKIFETSAWLNYSARLDSMALSVNGNVIATSVKLSIPISADVKAGTLVGSVTVKGALACTSNVEAEANATIQLVQEAGGVAAKAEVTDFNLDVKKLCVPGAVELLQAWSFSGVEAAVVSRVVAAALEKQIQKAVNDAVVKAGSDLPINKEVGTAVAKLQGAYGLGKDVWLKVEPKQVYLSQLSGATTGGLQTLSMTAGLDTDLTVIYGLKPEVAPLAAVPVSLGASTNRFRLAPRGTIAVSKMSEVLFAELNKLAGQQLKEAGFALQKVDVYQSGNLLVFGLDIKGKKFLRPSGTLYLSGKPVYDASRRVIRFDDFNFTLESQNWLVEHAAAVVQSKVAELAGKQMVFKVGDELDKLLTRFTNFNIPLSGGEISGVVTSVQLGSVWMQGDALNFDLLLEGTSRLDMVLK